MDDVEGCLRQALPRLRGLGAVVCFDLGDDGIWTVDARDNAPTLNEECDEDVACTIRLSADNLVKLMEGRMDPVLGYTLGRIKVRGSMGVAMKLVNSIG